MLSWSRVGRIADAVANARGGPVHVLTTNTEADHIPGCNFSVSKDCLEAIGGWDPRFRAAGDDVDLCWRLQDQGWRIGFSHGAVVWHHRRNSARFYWKQQQGYGKVEALLEEKWPQRHNAFGHIAWSGRLYGSGLTTPLRRAGRIYQGTWGTALFQSLYEPAPGVLAALPLMPGLWLIVATLVAALGLSWTPLLVFLPMLVVAMLLPVAQAAISVSHARFSGTSGSWREVLALRALAACLHLVQPLARLRGRVRHGLAPWRRRGDIAWKLPVRREMTVWSETWRAPEAWLGEVEERLVPAGAVAIRGGDLDHWDLEVRRDMFGSGRLLMAIEEHGSGRQLVRFRTVPRVGWLGTVLVSSVLALTVLAVVAQAWPAAAALALSGAIVLARFVLELAYAAGAMAWSVVETHRWIPPSLPRTLPTC